MTDKRIIFSFLLIVSVLIIGCSSNANVLSPDEIYSIPLSSVTDTVQKFEHDASGTTVRFFVVRGPDGNIKTAFDACDVCGGSKGYVQKGTDIECKNCGRVFDINGLGTKNKGYGCWPSFLSHQIVDGNVVISKQEIEAGKHRFA